MKPAYLYGIIITLATIGCSTQQNLITTQEGLAGDLSILQPVPPSNRVSYRLETQGGLPTSGRWKSTPVLTDINQDGFLDLAVHPRLEQGARVWLADNQGSWTDASQGLAMDTSCGGGLELGDINKDGKVDMAIGDHCSGVFVYLGRNNNTWQPTTQGLNSALAQKKEARSPDLNNLKGSEDLALGDVNEDGFLDIVATGADEGGFTVFLGDGSGKKWQETKADGLPSAEDVGDEEFHAGWSVDVQLHDMNNDNHLDVVATYYSGPHIWLGDGKGHWQSKATGLTVTSMGGIYRKLAVADINGDGLKDLAVANSLNGAEAYLQNADNTWQGPTDMLPQMKDGATAIALGDVDGDGHIDGIIGGRLTSQHDTPNGLHIVLGDGKGHWQYEQGTQLPVDGLQEIWGISLADLNGDKRLDMVVATGSTSTTTVKTSSTQVPNQTEESKLPHLQVWLNEPVDNKPL